MLTGFIGVSVQGQSRPRPNTYFLRAFNGRKFPGHSTIKELNIAPQATVIMDQGGLKGGSPTDNEDSTVVTAPNTCLNPEPYSQHPNHQPQILTLNAES
jgi:hypothetical protein